MGRWNHNSDEADDTDGLLLDLAAAEELAKTLPSHSRDRTLIEEVIQRLQAELYAMLAAGDEQESARASGPDEHRVQEEERR